MMNTTDHIPGLPGVQSIDGAHGEYDANLVLEVLGQGLCVCDSSGKIVWENQVFRRFASSLHEHVEEVSRALASGDRGKRRKRAKAHLKRSDRYYEVVVTMLDPSRHGIGSSGGAVAMATGALIPGPQSAMVALIRDVTAQERLRRKVATIDQAGGELVKLDAATIEQMHVAERLKLLESKVVSFAHDLLHFDHFTIRVLNEKTGELELVMASGLSQKALDIKLYAAERGQGISGHVAATGRPYVCHETSKDPLYVYGLDQCGSSLTVPLKLFGKTLGIFNVENQHNHAFSEHDRQFAEIFGRYIAMALYILNLLVMERYTTSKKATGTVQGELSEPLNDLTVDAQALREQTLDPQVLKQVERILKDVDSLKQRMKNVAAGPSTLLGVDDALECSITDPELLGKRVLVADNEPEISCVIRDVLSRRGMQVTVCDDGASAQKLLEQWRVTLDPDQGFDVIISDINLGDATGYDVFSSAKAASASIPVILMTGFGYDPHHSIVRASQEGLQCVLFKPFQVEKLIEEVKKALGGPATPPLL